MGAHLQQICHCAASPAVAGSASCLAGVARCLQRRSPAPAARAVASGSPGRSLRAAVWQGTSDAGDVEANLRRVAEVVSKARDQGVELVLFPELFASGYDCDSTQLRAAARAQGGASMRLVASLARDSGVCVALPYAETEHEAPTGGAVAAAPIYNSCAVFDASGRLALNYRKVNLWGPWEQASFVRGSSEQLRCADVALASGRSVRCGAMICYDAGLDDSDPPTHTTLPNRKDLMDVGHMGSCVVFFGSLRGRIEART
ncbi:unnamed protein product [Prorocentrum cordatum]|uniref:CN hydrolase domain-containing protein n=1 Tax=Prorocentrum cordatum TaxID=2364126 RepID=A0ABN9SQ00_9DINO|nr:unnamed protein product [Polarella glacialis]